MARARSRVVAWAASLGLATVFAGAACGAFTVGQEVSLCEATIGQQVVEGMNEARAEQGLSPLWVDLRLVTAAKRHAVDMSTHDFMSHDGSDGSTASDRVDDAGYAWTWISENVASGQMTAAFVVDAWMNSEGHRANILSTRARHVGVGYTADADGRLRHYWVTNFGDTDEFPTQVPSDGCHP